MLLEKHGFRSYDIRAEWMRERNGIIRTQFGEGKQDRREEPSRPTDARQRCNSNRREDSRSALALHLRKKSCRRMNVRLEKRIDEIFISHPIRGHFCIPLNRAFALTQEKKLRAESFTAGRLVLDHQGSMDPQTLHNLRLEP